MKDCCTDITFASHRFHLDARRALWWPEKALLAVADIHFEKARFFAGLGSLLPPHDTLDNLHRLQTLIGDYQPKTLICLGDSFHRGEQAERLSPPERNLLLSLCQGVPDWHWIVGNHDPLEALPYPGHLGREIQIGGITFTHGDGKLPEDPTILGHFHPKDTLWLRGRRVTGPCFSWNATHLVLPAFGTFTGGLNLGHEALQDVLGEHPCVGLIHGQTVGCYRRK